MSLLVTNRQVSHHLALQFPKPIMLQLDCRSLVFVIVFALLSPEVVSAQSEGDAPAVRTSISPGGMRRYERGRWSVVAIRASNGSQAETEASVSVFLESDSRTLFTRRFWLPADSIRKTWLPIRPADNIAPNRDTLRASALTVVGAGDRPVLNRTDGNQLISESLLSLDPSELHTGMISGRALPGELDTVAPLDDEAYETAVVVRMLHDGDRKIASFSDHFLPPYPEAYEALDQLVICSDRITADSGSIAAIRSWIARGGRAWIMLDLVGIEALQTLLGNASPCEILDRVELTEFTIETPGSRLIGAMATERWIAERPVELVRVLIDSAEVYSLIDGWPVAFSIPFGDGRVFITTLAARGWRYQLDEFADVTDPSQQTSGPTNALRYLASEFNQEAIGAPALSDEIKPILSEQLGYRVPSRVIAALILGLNCTVIAVAGVWLARRSNLERIAWVIPIATTICAGLLIMIGSANTSSVPPSSSILRLANVSSETNEIHADTLAAFYSPDTVELGLEVDLSGVVAPETQDLIGVAKRAVFDDDGRGRWEQVNVASGSVRFAHAKESRHLDHPLRARASFGANGLVGRIVGVGQIGTPGDAIIASPPAPHSHVTIDHAGNFRAGSSDLLSETEFLRGAMLSDEQQRRQTIYREILAPRQGAANYPQRPTLFVWGDSHSLGLTVPERFQESGAMLFAVPLDVGRTPAKQPFVIPSTFIRTTNAAATHGASAVYNPRTGRWMKGATLPTQSFFQFVLPRQVRPCRINGVDITLKIHAPSRTVELIGAKNDQQVVIETRKSPSGVLHFAIENPELLQLDEEGGLRFGVNVSPTESQAAAAAAQDQPRRQADREESDDSFEHSTWQIDYLRVQATGTTL